MAPELFAQNPSYGKEVDIWAFGAMMYEIATGMPPNVVPGMDINRMGAYLAQHIPRLEGGNYTTGLRSLVAFCLEERPEDRPTIEAVQRHSYLNGSSSKYPTTSLRELVKAFTIWEDRGNSRKSLFMVGGAPGADINSTSMADDSWEFSTTVAFDKEVHSETAAQDVMNVYGDGVFFGNEDEEATKRRPGAKSSRRRPPPQALTPMKAPLERLFDPNTISNYEDNSVRHYYKSNGSGMTTPTVAAISDLPLRDDAAQPSIRDTMIDLGEHSTETGMSSFPDLDTIKASRYHNEDMEDDDYDSGPLHDFGRSALSNPAESNPNRRTQDWKFPSMAALSADPELSRFPSNTFETPRPEVTPGSGARPTLTHHPTEPIGMFTNASFNQVPISSPGSPNRMSLIDLDLGLPDPPTLALPSFDLAAAETPRPSTANSDVGSTSGNPFEFDRDYTFPRTRNALNELAEVSDFSASEAENATAYSREANNGNRVAGPRTLPVFDGMNLSDDEYQRSSFASGSSGDPLTQSFGEIRSLNGRSALANGRNSARIARSYDMSHFGPLPAPPTAMALSGIASNEAMANETTRLLDGLSGQLMAFQEVYQTLRPSNRAPRSGNSGGSVD